MGGAWCNITWGDIGCDGEDCTWGGVVVCWSSLLKPSNYIKIVTFSIFTVCHPLLTQDKSFFISHM